MTRLRLALIALTLLIAAALAALLVVRSDWFSEKVRQRIIAEAARATNGRVELAAFHFDWRTLTAQVDRLVIHGAEPAGDAPLLAVDHIVIAFKVVSLLERKFNIARIAATAPRAHFIIQPDGSSNIPPPHRLTPQMLLDLRVTRFDLRDGQITADLPGQQRKIIPWNAHGENLSAAFRYDNSKARYDGNVSLSPVHLAWNGLDALDAQITATLALQKDLFTVPSATVTTASSQLELHDLSVASFAAPRATTKYQAKLRLEELDRIFRLVNFRHTGVVQLTGEARVTSAHDYQISGEAAGAGIGYGPVKNVSLAGKFIADPQKVALRDLYVKALGGTLRGAGELQDFQTFHVTGHMEHFQMRDLTSFAAMRPLPYDGLLSGPFDARGQLNERDFHTLVAQADVIVSPAPGATPARGEIIARYEGKTNQIELGHSWIELPQSRADLSGIPGLKLQVRLDSRDLNELRPVIAIPAPLHSGALAFEGSLSGSLANPAIAGHGALRHAVWQNEHVDSLSGDIVATDSQVAVTGLSLAWKGLEAKVTGSLGLTAWHPGDSSPLQGSVQFQNGDLTKLADLTGRKDLPVSGTLAGSAQLTGMLGAPQATADVMLSKGQLYGEPYDSATGRLEYRSKGTETFAGVVNAGAKHIAVTAGFEEAPRKLTFHLSSNALALDQIALLRKREPDLRGTAQVKADGAVAFQHDPKTGLPFTLLSLNSEINGSGLQWGARAFGDAHLVTSTKGDVLTARFDSNAVKAVIHGNGSVSLGGDYPVDARFTFSNLKLKAVAAAIDPSILNHTDAFDDLAAGDMTLTGPAAKPDLLTAAINFNQFELRPVLPASSQPNTLQTLVLRNNGPIRMTLSQSAVRIDSARFAGPETSMELAGSILLNQQAPLDLRLQGDINMALARTINPDINASGRMLLNATVRGAFDQPDFSGRAEMRKSEFHYADFANGLTNANGVFLFNGNRATIQTFSAESGGGKVDATGFLALTNGLVGFRVEAKARAVRFRYPEGISSVSDADLTLAGTSERSEAAGRITVQRISVNPKADLASILAASVQPLRTPAARTGLIANLNLDVQIETAPDVALETSVAQSIQADASLRLRGTATNPALLGRINVTQGELVFFGNKYTINQGSVSFLNPARIDPILNVDLETRSRGVDVILTVSGPIAKLNVSYRSDPPLQFGDIVALLATGRAPTGATLAASNTGQSQAFQQLGASELIGQALAGPPPGRLERFFGVSRIKIDPQLLGVTGSPTARLTVEQQVTPNVQFTYVSDVADTSTQIVRVEWDFNRRWGAILTRQENGYIGLDFAWKKRFK